LEKKMKRTTAVVLLFTLVLSAGVTSFGQASRPSRPPTGRSDLVQYQDIRSYTDGQGVYIRWQTAVETRNVGFYVYRMTAGGAQRVNANIVGGAATKSLAPARYGERYELYDTEGALGSVYYIESLSTSGQRVSTATFTPKFTENFERDTGHPKSYFEQLAQNRNGDLQHQDLRLPKELGRSVTESLLPPDLNVHRWVVAQPGAKIAVKQDGIYRVTRTELQNAGFNVNSNSANWRLFMEGNEQAIIVGAGDQYIEFYGRGIDTVESDTRMYYLIADAAPGRRMATRVLNPLGGNVVSNSYTASAVRQERFQFYPKIINGPAGNYFGTFISDSQVTIPNPGLPNYVPYNITGIDFNVPTASVRLRLQGFQNGPHTVRAEINGNLMGFVSGNDQDNFFADFTIPTSWLIEGPNFLRLNGSTASDYTLFDTVTVNYARRYTAEQNRLGFFTPGYRRVNVGTFTTPGIRVFDTTYDANPQVLINYQIVDNGGTFSANLPSDRAAVMYAVEDSGLLQSPSVAFNTPSTLSLPSNSAQVLIISHSAPDYLTAGEAWANYRRTASGGSFSARVIDVADIYDEFGYGVASADSIRDFLHFAGTAWTGPLPRYVLLLGDGSYDPRNYEGFGNWNLVPVKMVSLLFGESGSDEALPDWDNDGTANIPIGRIPARSAVHITTALNKTIGFETPAQQNLVTRGALFSSGLPQGFDFEALNAALRAELPPGTLVYWVTHGQPPPNQNVPDPNANANLMAGLNQGPHIVNYAGHGSAGAWDSSSFFDIAHVPALANGSNQSIYTMLTCLNGLFTRPVNDSLAEALLKSTNGGAAAAWASTTDTTPDMQSLMAVRFYDQISIGNIRRIGDLVVDAKSFSLPPSSEVGYSWVLFGDPALQVR
jgi:hypothetical protein